MMLPAPMVAAAGGGGDCDLMDDIYSLHTERDIQHRKELQDKQCVIDELNQRNIELTSRNTLLSHNISLLLVSQIIIKFAQLIKKLQCLKRQIISQTYIYHLTVCLQVTITA